MNLYVKSFGSNEINDPLEKSKGQVGIWVAVIGKCVSQEVGGKRKLTLQEGKVQIWPS